MACVSVYPSNSWGIEVVLTYFIQYIFELSGIFFPKIHFNYDIPRIMQIIRLSDTNVSQQKDNFRNGIGRRKQMSKAIVNSYQKK